MHPAPSTFSIADAGEPAPHRLATSVEQIVDGLTRAMLQGRYEAGSRIGEQEVADRYGVSRGPVREALRALATSGLVELSPRRGAFAVGIGLDIVADLFNVRAALMGLAVCCFTRAAPTDGLAEMDTRLAQLRTLAAQPDPGAFATGSARLGATLYRHCGSPYLLSLLRDGTQTPLWGLIWRDRPLDFHTSPRRHAMLRLWQAVGKAVHAGDEAEAERVTRRILLESRDAALATLAKESGHSASPVKLIKASP